jgi:hypothetical protein
MKEVIFEHWFKAPNTYGAHFFEVTKICQDHFGLEYVRWSRTNNDEFYFANEKDLAWFLLLAGHLLDKAPRARWPFDTGTGSTGPR